MWLKPRWPTHGDTYHTIWLQTSESWQHHDVQFRGLCGQMPWSTMEVSYQGQWWIPHVALYISPLYIIRVADGCFPRYGCAHIQLHAASYSCCFQSYGQFLNLHPASEWQWLHWHDCGGLTRVCVVAVCKPVTHWMMRPLIGSIRIHSHLPDMCVQPWFAGLE